MTKPVIVLGAGGHAKVVIDVLRLSGVRILGIVAKDLEAAGSNFPDLEILGGNEIVFDYPENEIDLVNGLGSLPGYNQRAELFRTYSERDYHFQSVVHPSAIIANDVELSQGVHIMAGAVIQPGSSIGKNTIINTRASIDHDCVIGDNCHVAPGAVLSGGVILGESVHIGTGASLVQLVEIGNHTVVGAGAVVTQNVLKHSIVYPARSLVEESSSDE